MEKKNLGIFYAILSSLFLSTGFIFAKHFLQYTSIETLNTLWFGIAFIISIIILLARNSKATVKSFREHWKDGLVVGGANGIAAALWFHSLNITGSTLTAFLVRFSTIFIIILGVVFLKEKLHFHDMVGMGIAVIGAVVINFEGGNYFKVGTAVAIAASFAIAIHQVLSKIYVKTIDPLTLVSLRTFFTALFLGIFAIATSSIEPFPLQWLPLLVIAIVINAIFGFVFFYKALELIDVSRVAVIRTLDPFVVVIYVFMIYQGVPDFKELLGGSLVILGVLVTMYGHGMKTTLIRSFRWLPWFG